MRKEAGEIQYICFCLSIIHAPLFFAYSVHDLEDTEVEDTDLVQTHVSSETPCEASQAITSTSYHKPHHPKQQIVRHKALDHHPFPPQKKAKVDNECDKIIIQSLRDIQETAQHHQTHMDANFCLEVAGRLKRLEPRKNVYVKLEMRGCTMLNSVNDVIL